MLNGLDLFSGIGGITLALESVVKPIAYCESDRYAQSVLLSRMASGQLPKAPIWDDIRTLDMGKLGRVGDIDIIYGGFPCQDISVAGLNKGLAGERSGLFSEIMRLAQEIKPKFIFLENVPAIRTRGLEHVVEWLAAAGYDCRWDIISAAEVGACHIRKRWFLLAYSNGLRLRKKSGTKNSYQSQPTRALVSDNSGIPRRAPRASEGFSKPSVDRTGDGVPKRVVRHRALGNAVVPEQVKKAWLILTGQLSK